MIALARFAAIAIFLFGTFATFYQAAESTELAWWGESFPFVAFLTTAALLFVGIVFGCLFRQISNSQSKINIVNEFKAVFSAPSFWTAMCVSPFVFFSVYAVVSVAPGDAASYLLAFQNGFFCESVFRQLMRSPPETQTQTAPVTTFEPQTEAPPVENLGGTQQGTPPLKKRKTPTL